MQKKFYDNYIFDKGRKLDLWNGNRYSRYFVLILLDGTAAIYSILFQHRRALHLFKKGTGILVGAEIKK